MMRQYRNCTEEQRKLFERAANVAAEWLNAMNTLYGDLANHPEDRATWDGLFDVLPGPHLVFDSERLIFNDCRLMVFELNFFHDEGGGAEMMCLFDEDSELEEAWWAFDTMTSHIYGPVGNNSPGRGLIHEEKQTFFSEEGI